MAVGQSSDGDSKHKQPEGVESCSREDADAAQPGLIQLRKIDGNSSCFLDKGAIFRKKDVGSLANNGHQHINKAICGLLKSYKLKRKRNKGNDSDSLSDIDDAEVSGYLNTKKEVHYKRILWEAMNRNYTKAKKQKSTIEAKMGAPVKNASRATKKVESQRPTSRINYDVLKLLIDELNEDSETAQTISTDPSPHSTEDEHVIHSSKVNETFSHDDDDDGEMYYEHEHEHSDDDLGFI